VQPLVFFERKCKALKNLGTVKVKDITGEFNAVFTNAIEQATSKEGLKTPTQIEEF
jgi:hypothetical protein